MQKPGFEPGRLGPGLLQLPPQALTLVFPNPFMAILEFGTLYIDLLGVKDHVFRGLILL